MKAEEIDRKFDAGEDITEYLDVASTHRAQGLVALR